MSSSILARPRHPSTPEQAWQEQYEAEHPSPVAVGGTYLETHLGLGLQVVLHLEVLHRLRVLGHVQAHALALVRHAHRVDEVRDLKHQHRTTVVSHRATPMPGG